MLDLPFKNLLCTVLHSLPMYWDTAIICTDCWNFLKLFGTRYICTDIQLPFVQIAKTSSYCSVHATDILGYSCPLYRLLKLHSTVLTMLQMYWYTAALCRDCQSFIVLFWPCYRCTDIQLPFVQIAKASLYCSDHATDELGYACPLYRLLKLHVTVLCTLQIYWDTAALCTDCWNFMVLSCPCYRWTGLQLPFVQIAKASSYCSDHATDELGHSCPLYRLLKLHRTVLTMLQMYWYKAALCTDC